MVEHGLLGGGLPVPHAHTLVHGCRDDLRPVRAEGGRPDRSLMSFEQRQGRARAHVPEARRCVIGGRHDPAAVAAESRAGQAAAVAREGRARLACARVPDARQIVVGDRRKPPAIGAECGVSDDATALQQDFDAAAERVPHRAVPSIDAVTIFFPSGLKEAE